MASFRDSGRRRFKQREPADAHYRGHRMVAAGHHEVSALLRFRNEPGHAPPGGLRDAQLVHVPHDRHANSYTVICTDWLASRPVEVQADRAARAGAVVRVDRAFAGQFPPSPKTPCPRTHSGRWQPGASHRTAYAWGLPELIEDGELIASELVTSVVRRAHDPVTGRPVYVNDRLPVLQFGLFCDRTVLLISVWDQFADPPVRTIAAADDEAGRGLMMVGRIAASLDWFPAEGGKVVRAFLQAA
jgi:hypothetical protein